MGNRILFALLFVAVSGVVSAQTETPTERSDDQDIREQLGDAMDKRAGGRKPAAMGASACAALDIGKIARGGAAAAVQSYTAACTSGSGPDHWLKSGAWSGPAISQTDEGAVAKAKAEGIARYFVAELADVDPLDFQRESFGKRQYALEQAWFAIEAVPIDAPLKNELLGKVADDADALVRNRITSFWGNFAAGLLINFKKDPPVESATVSTVTSGVGGATGTVKVEYADEIKVGLGLEAHRFLWGWRFGEGNNKAKYTGDYNSSVAFGPYIGVMPGTKDIVDVLSGGLLVGILGDPHFGKSEAKISMNIGVGYFLDFNSLHLANGFQDGQPLPQGETFVRLTEETDEGLQVNVSFGATFGGSRAGLL